MYRYKILGVAALSAAIVLLSAGLATWSVRATDRHLEQAALAHSLLSEHLHLSVRAYRLFKQLTDEVVLGARANQIVARNKQAAIEESLNRIRDLEHRQREALGIEATRGTVEDTDALDALIATIIREFDAVLAMSVESRDPRAVATLLEDRIDIAFREAVNAALARQQRVVDAMTRRVERVHQQLLIISFLLALVMVGVAIWASTCLIIGISRPLTALRTGAEALAGGDTTHRLPRGFDAEFDAVAGTFNSMAEQLQARQQTREQSQLALESAVRERTAELQALNETLKHADGSRRHFLADVSHELRTPLTIIRGEAQVALRAASRSTDDYREALRSILEQSVSLSTLVEDLLFVARVDAGSVRLSRRVMHLDDLVEMARQQFEGLRGTRSVHLVVRQQAEQALPWTADPQRLRQLLGILLDNALRYSPEGGDVQLHCDADAEGLCLGIQDAGPGIAAEELPFVFERFFRGVNAEHQSSQGVGLGLAVAKAIVEAHGGRIEASSAPGAGTRMTVWIPREPA